MSNFIHQSEALGNTSSHVLLIFQCNILVFYTFLLGIAMVKYFAVAVCRNGTHNRQDLFWRILLFLRTTLGEESGSCSVNELAKSSRALSIRRSVSYVHFKKMDVTVSVSGRKSVTG